ncbi:MAG TPA: cytochrome c biogenesis protein CcsA [Terriglobales bacterium]|nr:cytochrome c biogenesis protein CcsA [Terriglobales bacterium]
MHSLLSFSILWTRVALGLYLAGLAAAVVAALIDAGETRRTAFGLTRAAVAAGFLFQFVSQVEMLAGFRVGQVSFFRVVAGLLAFIVAAFFLMVYRAYSPRALSLVITPLTCVLAAAAAFAPDWEHSAPTPAAAALLHNGWIDIHIVLILLGYAGLVVAVASGVTYLAAQRSLKAKSGPIASARMLPPLETLDAAAYRSLLVGFPLLTAGLAIGAYWENVLYGGVSLSDPTVMLALLAWAVYLVLLFARWSAGWRGRRSAYLTLVCFGLALAGWLANGVSRLHAGFPR